MHPVDKVITAFPDTLRFSDIRAGIGACQLCEIHKQKAQPRAGKIPVLFVGESPSKIGCVKNDIFRGKAVFLMHKYKDKVYETNAISCHSYPPQSEHVKACQPWLKATILSIPAKAVFTFGVTAHKAVLGLGLGNEIEIHKFDHPCYIIRFYKENGYKWKEFTKAVDKALQRYEI